MHGFPLPAASGKTHTFVRLGKVRNMGIMHPMTTERDT
jgi:hypothetical protein